MSKGLNTDPEFTNECASIDNAREQAFADLAEANRRGITPADVAAMKQAMAGVDRRCEVLRKRFYPNRHKLIIALGAAFTVSRTDRSRQTVWSSPIDAECAS